MNNLLSLAISSIIKNESNVVLSGIETQKELRIMMPAFHPIIIREINEILYDLFSNKGKLINIVFRVEPEIWNYWRTIYAENKQLISVLDELEEKSVVDFNNSLTYYRNKKYTDNYELNLTILAGIEFSPDRGGLSDFFLIDEDYLWKHFYNASYKKYIEWLLIEAKLSWDKSDLQLFEELLSHLSKYQSGNLTELSIFLANIKEIEDCTIINAKQLYRHLYKHLNFWGIPPIDRESVSTKDIYKFIDTAYKYISVNSLTDHERKTCIKKIEAFIDKVKNEGSFMIPECFEGDNPYSKEMEYLEDLLLYITKNDIDSRRRLLKVDCIPFLVQILGLKLGKPSKKIAIKKISAPLLEGFLKAIWYSLVDYIDENGGLFQDKSLKIVVDPLKFASNIAEDDEKLSAEDLIRQLLGGIEKFIDAEIECGNNKVKADIRFCQEKVEEIVIISSKQSDPYLEIRISINDEISSPISYQYRILVPDILNEVVFINLVTKISKELGSGNYYLPSFFINTYNEIFFSNSSEEANRLVNIGLYDFEVVDLLKDLIINRNSLGRNNEILPIISKCTTSYISFIKNVLSNGLYFALDEPLSRFIDDYKNMIEYILGNNLNRQHDVFNIIYKAFLLLDKTCDIYRPYLSSAITSALHPSMAELIQARERYLSEGFKILVARLFTDENKLSELNRELNRLWGMSEIKRSLYGIVVDSNRVFSTDMTELGWIHCYGIPSKIELDIISECMLRKEEFVEEDDEISKSDLFCTTPESSIVTNVLLDYSELVEHTYDCLTILAINTVNVQMIIAGLDSYLSNILESKQQNIVPFQLNIIFYINTNSIQNVHRWLDSWRNNWNNENSNNPYKNCQIKIRLKHSFCIEDYETFLREEKDFIDVIIISNFLRLTQDGDEFIFIDNNASIVDTNYLKFPINEYPCAISQNIANKSVRGINISNRRFESSTLHSELSARITDSTTQKGYNAIAKITFDNWVKFFNLMHKSASWVVSIDPYIDRKLILNNAENNSNRTIVGYSTGLGNHGELNVTTSTDIGPYVELVNRIEKLLRIFFSSWNSESYKFFAQKLLVEAESLYGIQLIKGTRNNDRARDLVAYSLVRMLLTEQDNPLCDIIIQLDSYLHWLQNSDSGERPDLIRLKVYEINAEFLIEATIIECKLANLNDVHLQKANAQVQSGLKTLVKTFLPYIEGESEQCFDRRYWWAQLYRLLASAITINTENGTNVQRAFEKLSEGIYKICWHGEIFAFWNNVDIPQNSEEKSSIFIYPLIDNEFTYECDIITRTITSAYIEKNIPQGTRLTAYNCKRFIEHTYSGTANNDNGVIDNNSSKEELETNKKEDETSESRFNGRAADNETTPKQQKVDLPLESSNMTEFGKNPVSSNVISRIPLGESTNEYGTTGRTIYWEYGHSDLQNRHLLIFGKSGSGKTYAIQGILLEMAKNGLKSIIIDYTDGFLPNHLDSTFRSNCNPQQHIVCHKPLRVNPFTRYAQKLEGFDDGQVAQEKIFSVAVRFVSILSSVYDMGEQQKSILTQVLEAGIEKNNFYTLKDLFEDLQKYSELEIISGQTAANKIYPLVKSDMFDFTAQNSWNELLDKALSKINIIQFTSISKDLAKIGTEVLLWDIFYHAKNYGHEKYPLPLVLDEIQNLDHKEDSPLDKILREGRKFGISAILATQTLNNLKSDAQARLFQAAHKLFFLPAETEIKEYARILSNTDDSKSLNDWVRKLSNLKKGECYSLGPSMDKNGQLHTSPVKIKISAMDERLKNGKS